MGKQSVMVSIIVTAYNLSEYIDRCIDSIISQSDTRWELIIIDDGSTDETSIKCDKYASNDNRIKIIHQENKGVTNARIRGIKEASFDRVIIMDGDDTLNKDAIKKIHELIEENTDSDLIITNTTNIYQNPKSLISAILNRNIDTALWGKIYHKNILSPIIENPQFFSDINIDEDMLMLIASINDAKKTVYSEINFYDYNIRRDGLSRQPISIKSCQKLFYNLSSLINKYNLNTDFFFYRLRFIYNNCISKGVKFSNSEPIIRELTKESKQYNLTGQDKMILRMLHSRILRHIVAQRHKDIQPVTTTKISIIMAAYNQKKHIARAIKSVLKQSFRDFELIIVDDYSSDCTRQIIQSFANVDNRVKLICHSKNMGQSAARLTGLASAKGEYITFIDNDDTLNIDALNKLWQKAKSTEADIVVMGSSRVSRFSFLKIPLFIPSRFFQKELYHTTELLNDILIHSGFSVAQWDKLYRKSFLDGINFIPEKCGEDMLFNIQVFSKSGLVSWVDYIGYNWHSGGQSSKSPQLLWNDDKFIFYRCLELSTELHKNSLSKGLIKSFIDKIAQSIAISSNKKEDLKHWISQELNDPVWESTNICEQYCAIKDKDTDAVYSLGHSQFSSHRLFYTILKLIF